MDKIKTALHACFIKKNRNNTSAENVSNCREAVLVCQNPEMARQKYTAYLQTLNPHEEGVASLLNDYQAKLIIFDYYHHTKKLSQQKSKQMLQDHLKRRNQILVCHF